MQVIVCGDDLYAHEPFLKLLQEQRLRFVLVARPESHQELFDWVEDLDRIGACERGQWQEGPEWQASLLRIPDRSPLLDQEEASP
jgi:hypothetical protein